MACSKFCVSGNSDDELRRRIAITHQCMNQLEKRILTSHYLPGYDSIMSTLIRPVLLCTAQKPGR